MGFQPVGDGALPDAFGTAKVGVYPADVFKHIQQAVFDILAAVDDDKELVLDFCFLDGIGFDSQNSIYQGVIKGKYDL